jgi:hypothetical protein
VTPKPEQEHILAIAVGDTVVPGPHWNTLRLGSPYVDDDRLRQGTVVELGSWGAGSKELDCATVKWTDQDEHSQPLIYRWGVLALNGERMYDLHKSNDTSR